MPTPTGSGPHLNHAVEQLLDHAASALHPLLLLPIAEEVGRLDDGHGVVHHVGQRLVEEIESRAEVRVEDGDEVARGVLEGVSQVPGLPHVGAVGAPHICSRRERNEA